MGTVYQIARRFTLAGEQGAERRGCRLSNMLAGVKADFENYEGMVCRRGCIVSNDYGTADWPEVKQFVDNEVRPDSRVAVVVRRVAYGSVPRGEACTPQAALIGGGFSVE